MPCGSLRRLKKRKTADLVVASPEPQCIVSRRIPFTRPTTSVGDGFVKLAPAGARDVRLVGKGRQQNRLLARVQVIENTSGVHCASGSESERAQ